MPHNQSAPAQSVLTARSSSALDLIGTATPFLSDPKALEHGLGTRGVVLFTQQLIDDDGTTICAQTQVGRGNAMAMHFAVLHKNIADNANGLEAVITRDGRTIFAIKFNSFTQALQAGWEDILIASSQHQRIGGKLKTLLQLQMLELQLHALVQAMNRV